MFNYNNAWIKPNSKKYFLCCYKRSLIIRYEFSLEKIPAQWVSHLETQVSIFTNVENKEILGNIHVLIFEKQDDLGMLYFS